jgi:hypothetical protein
MEHTMTTIDMTSAITGDSHRDRFAAVMLGLQAQFPGRALLSLGEALLTLPGAAPAEPDSAALQRRSAGTYPYPVTRIGQRRVVLLVDVAAALLAASAASADDTQPIVQPVPAPRPARRGRPRQKANGGAA